MTLAPATVAGLSLTAHVHACGLFSSREEEYTSIAPFIQEAIDNRERTIILGDPNELASHRQQIADRGIEVERAEAGGYLSVVDWDQAYLLDGHFDVQRMLGMVDTLCEQAKLSGFPRGPFIGHMEWALLGRPGSDQVIDFECRVNEVLLRHGHPAICVYDVTRFDAATIIDILRTHPLVIMNGVAQENPFYQPPAEFLAQYQSRLPAMSSSGA